MSIHAYPMTAIAVDYLRAALGLSLVGVPLALAEMATALTVLLAGFAIVFVLHGARTASRHVARIELGQDGICSHGFVATTIRWDDLQTLQLSHYSTRRDRSGGWLQLLLTGSGQRLRIDSHLDGFEALTARAAVAARANGISLDPTTVSNLDALGLWATMAAPAPWTAPR